MTGVLRGNVMGLRGMLFSFETAVVGAIVYWASSAQTSMDGSHGFGLPSVGIIVLLAAGAGFVISAATYLWSRVAAVGD